MTLECLFGTLRHAQIDFRPITESYEKLFGLPIHHWPIKTKVVRLLWINTIPQNYFVTLESLFRTLRHDQIDFRPVTESYEKLFGLLIHHWPITTTVVRLL